MGNCLNCNTVYATGQHFCGNCGQKTATHRLSMHDLWHDVVHYFTHADKGIFFLIRQLIAKPGAVASEYVHGHRKRHFPPLNFFLIVAALYVFMNNVTSHAVNNAAASSYQQNAYTATKPAENTVSKEIGEKRLRILRFITKNANWVAMFAAPFISVLMWLFFRRAQYNYTEHLVANLYLIGFTNLIRCLLIMPAMAIFAIPSSNRPIQITFMVFEIGYRTIFYHRFIGKQGTASWLWVFFTAILAVVIWVTVTFLWIMFGPYII